MKQTTMRKWLASALIAAGITATASPLGPAAFADVGLAEVEVIASADARNDEFPNSLKSWGILFG